MRPRLCARSRGGGAQAGEPCVTDPPCSGAAAQGPPAPFGKREHREFEKLIFLFFLFNYYLKKKVVSEAAFLPLTRVLKLTGSLLRR